MVGGIAEAFGYDGKNSSTCFGREFEKYSLTNTDTCLLGIETRFSRYVHVFWQQKSHFCIFVRYEATTEAM